MPPFEAPFGAFDRPRVSQPPRRCDFVPADPLSLSTRSHLRRTLTASTSVHQRLLSRVRTDRDVEETDGRRSDG